ncbi:shikimate kinase [Aminicella lysinilytica]|uniref:Shikimate kinase n=1 Tax=Aminicella lysinilytica TaxID=433323 RepID=A0A4R6QG92_9FIRM|nr:shikimate kinase [Aminicella lysinilytica]TDP60549.1 shikimate kinase [Aminicella lysinilytica]
MKSNIILIGMPACGKSTVGVVLAKTVNKGFLDTDLLIQQREGRRLQEIIDAEGNDYFRRVERSVLMDFKGSGQVVATGGSAVYFDDAMEHFRRDGVVVYLKVSPENILDRMSNIRTRGISMDKGQTIEELYLERAPLYEKYADITVDADGCTVEQVIEKIVYSSSFLI